jgi:hypothetical protein
MMRLLECYQQHGRETRLAVVTSKQSCDHSNHPASSSTAQLASRLPAPEGEDNPPTLAPALLDLSRQFLLDDVKGNARRALLLDVPELPSRSHLSPEVLGALVAHSS